MPDTLPTRYRVVDLGGVADTNCVYAHAVNDAGIVVGYAFTAPGHGAGMLGRPFVWQAGVLTRLPLAGAEFGHAYTVNRRGDIGGGIHRAGGDVPVVWVRARRYAPRFLKGAGSVTHLRDDGVAVGSEGGLAALWADGKLQRLDATGTAASRANAVNRHGVAVGFRIPQGGQAESIRTAGDRRATLWMDGRERALPELPGSRISEALSLDDNGTIVGWCEVKNTQQACVWKKEAVSPLPGLSSAQALAPDGVLLGRTTDGAAVLWRNDQAIPLNRQIPTGSGWKIANVTGINAAGWIVGYGHHKTHQYWRGFVLIPEPARGLRPRV